MPSILEGNNSDDTMSSRVYQNDAYSGISESYLTPFESSHAYESISGSTRPPSVVQCHNEEVYSRREDPPSRSTASQPCCKSPPWWGWAILVVGILLVAAVTAGVIFLSTNKGTPSGGEGLSPSPPSTDSEEIPPSPPTRPGITTKRDEISPPTTRAIPQPTPTPQPVTPPKSTTPRIVPPPTTPRIVPTPPPTSPADNKCDATPCENGGTCNTWEYDPWYYCWCRAGFTGHNCDVLHSTTAGGKEVSPSTVPPPAPTTPRPVPPPAPTTPRPVPPPAPTSPDDISDCSEATTSGVYIVKSGLNIKAYCQVDHTGKWTVIQRREDGSVSFSRIWIYYAAGFGSLSGEHWLGNENIHALTAAGLTKLRVDLEDWENTKFTVYYDVFKVAGADKEYQLTVSGFDGPTPPDNALLQHSGMRFTTTDNDNDARGFGANCARTYSAGGWWYRDCVVANLNGQYNNTETGRGINWYYWKGWNYSLRKTAMMIRKP